MKKFIVIAFMALAVTMIAAVPAKASDVTPTEDPSPTPSAMPNPYSKLLIRSDGSVNMDNVKNAYENYLTSGQRQLACYLVGLSNYMYLTARGFKYNNISLAADLQARLLAVGERFFGTLYNQFSSRLTPYMQQFISACVSYAGQQDIEEGFLSNWLLDHGEDIYIPYTDNALAGWTAFYNDPSTTGVTDWGVYNSDWVSGQFFDYAYSDYIFLNDTANTRYNNFLLNNSPVVYTSEDDDQQAVISLKDKYIFDELYILRANQNNYRSYRFICSESPGTAQTFSYIRCSLLTGYNPPSVNVFNMSISINQNIVTIDQGFTLKGIINEAFRRTPFYDIYTIEYRSYENYYPYIEHVYLVDDLNTFANKQEIFNTTDLDINGDQAKWIKTPKGQVLYYPIGSGAILTEFPLPDLLKKDDGNGNLISIDPTKDLTQQIVNNTVINNYNIVAPGSIINVPVDWLESEGNYLEYANNTALPFFVMVGDIFNALGEIRIFIVAVLILGLAGGVLVKFLL